MNEPEVRLHRLFAAALTAPDAPEPDVMPGYLKTRVIAHWRLGPPAAEFASGLVLIFRSALIGAAVVMLASLAWSFDELTHEPEDDVAVANYEWRKDVMP